MLLSDSTTYHPKLLNGFVLFIIKDIVVAFPSTAYPLHIYKPLPLLVIFDIICFITRTTITASTTFTFVLGIFIQHLSINTNSLFSDYLWFSILRDVNYILICYTFWENFVIRDIILDARIIKNIYSFFSHCGWMIFFFFLNFI